MTRLIPPFSPSSNITTWIFRFLGVFLLYTSLTISPKATLMGTPLVRTIEEAYPTWYHILWDIFLPLLILGILANMLKFFIVFAKKHHVSKKIIVLLRTWDSRLFRAFVSFEFFASRWLIGAGCSLMFWYLVISPIATALLLHVPTYHSQPVIMIIGVLGILLLIESISFWQQKMQKYFCIHVHL